MAINEEKLISVENTRFIFSTNFSGDPSRDKYRSPERKANLVIPDVKQAREMIDAGMNVKMTHAREGEEEGFIPTYYVPVKVNYNIEWERLKPKIYLVNDVLREPLLLDEDSVGSIDDIDISNVNVTLKAREWDRDGNKGITLWVRTMYVEQELSDDPFAERYRKQEVEPEEMPFA